MAKPDWKKIVGTVAPALATALGGPLAGVAVKTIADRVLDKPEATEEEVEAAIVGANPDTLLKLRQVDLEFKQKMIDAGIKLEEVAAGDRDSARRRQVELKDHTPAILAYLYLGTFLVVLVMQFYIVIKNVQFNEGAVRILDGLTGILGTLVIGSKDYFFGSSAGSKEKTELINRAISK